MRSRLTLLLVGALGLVGCAATGDTLQPFTTKSSVIEGDTSPISRIVCLWEPGVGRIPNGPKRGVLGQILFFSGAEQTPRKVKGGVSVYLFDDLGTPEEQSKPILKLVLTPKELTAVHSETALGHVYHVPVPYPKDHRLQTTCALRVKYTSPDGQVTYSDIGNVLLEGAERQSKGVTVTRSVKEAGAEAQSGTELTPEQIHRRIGRAEVQETSAGKDRLRSLTIRRDAPVSSRHSFRDRQKNLGQFQRE